MTLADFANRLDAVLEVIGSVSLALTALAALLPKGWRITKWAARAGMDLRDVGRHHAEMDAASKREPERVSVECPKP